MKKQMTALVLGAALSLSAATAVPFETSVSGGWKQVGPNTFEVKNKGAWHASVVLKAGLKQGCYYRVSWDASSRKGQGVTSYGLILKLGETLFSGVNIPEESSPRAFCFHSGKADKTELSFFFSKEYAGDSKIANLKLEELDDADMHENLLINGDFEADNLVPGDWLVRSKEFAPYMKIVENAGFVNGAKSLELTQKKDAPATAIESVPLQILPGKTYTLSFWAKAEGPDKMTVVIDMPSYGKKQEFQKFYPFALSGEWTKFTCKVTFPSDEAQFSLLARRRARVNIFCDNHNDGRILLDQLEFKAEE